MADSMTVTSNVSTTVVEVGDGTWRCAHPGLGLVVYGRTSDQAAEKFVAALSFFVDYLMKKGGLVALEGRLKRGNIDVLLEVSEPKKPKSIPLSLGISRTLEPV